MSRLKECCCGCSVRTGTLIVLWTDACGSAFMGMIFLLTGYGVTAGIHMFKSFAEYSYNAAKFFYHQTKAFGGDANIEDFEAVWRTSQNIDPRLQYYAKILCSCLFYWNLFLILCALIGMVAVHEKKNILLMFYAAVKLIETIAYGSVVMVSCYNISVPSVWLIAFPGLINVGLKLYSTIIVHSYWGELQYIEPDENEDHSDDVKFAKKTQLHHSYDF